MSAEVVSMPFALRDTIREYSKTPHVIRYIKSIYHFFLTNTYALPMMMLLMGMKTSLTV